MRTCGDRTVSSFIASLCAEVSIEMDTHIETQTHKHIYRHAHTQTRTHRDTHKKCHIDRRPVLLQHSTMSTCSCGDTVADFLTSFDPFFCVLKIRVRLDHIIHHHTTSHHTHRVKPINNTAHLPTNNQQWYILWQSQPHPPHNDANNTTSSSTLTVKNTQTNHRAQACRALLSTQLAARCRCSYLADARWTRPIGSALCLWAVLIFTRNMATYRYRTHNFKNSSLSSKYEP